MFEFRLIYGKDSVPRRFLFQHEPNSLRVSHIAEPEQIQQYSDNKATGTYSAQAQKYVWSFLSYLGSYVPHWVKSRFQQLQPDIAQPRIEFQVTKLDDLPENL